MFPCARVVFQHPQVYFKLFSPRQYSLFNIQFENLRLSFISVFEGKNTKLKSKAKKLFENL